MKYAQKKGAFHGSNKIFELLEGFENMEKKEKNLEMSRKTKAVWKSHKLEMKHLFQIRTRSH